MARKVFFSFHYERDSWRAAQVRNSDITKKDIDSAGFIDAASWQEVEKEGEESIKKWISNQLNGTSVTVVLIGAETSNRPWVIHEIKESHKRGNGMIGVRIHSLKNQSKETDYPGNNPFDRLYIEKNGTNILLSKLYRVYDWTIDEGYNNLGKWVEEAFQKANSG